MLSDERRYRHSVGMLSAAGVEYRGQVFYEPGTTQFLLGELSRTARKRAEANQVKCRISLELDEDGEIVDASSIWIDHPLRGQRYSLSTSQVIRLRSLISDLTFA